MGEYLNIIDKDLTSYYIKAPKILFIIFLSLSCVFLILSTFVIYILYFAGISILIALIFLITYVLHTKKYGNKILLKDDGLEIYNLNTKFLFSFDFSDVTFTQQFVKFPGPRCTFTKMECIVLSANKAEVWDEMEYPKDSNIIVIQNPNLIQKLISLPTFKLKQLITERKPS